MNPRKESKKHGRVISLLKSKPLRATLSILLLLLLVSRLNLGELASTLSGVSAGYLLLGIFTFIAASLLSIFKWQLILRALEMHAGFFYLVSLFYMGLFFSNFLPTNFGGDVFKIYRLSRNTGCPVESTSSVFLDRASSTFALLLIAVPPALFELRTLGAAMTALVLSLFFFLVIVIFLIATPGIAPRLGNLPLLRRDFFGLRRYVREFYFSLHEFRHEKKALMVMLAISLIYQAIQILAIYFLALSLGIQLSPLYYFIFIPVIQAVSMIPISLNGLGVREGTWVLLFSGAGVPAAAAFSMSILSLLVMTGTSVFGGILYLFDRNTPIPQTEPEHGRT